MRVWIDPADGTRHYVPDDDPGGTPGPAAGALARGDFLWRLIFTAITGILRRHRRIRHANASLGPVRGPQLVAQDVEVSLEGVVAERFGVGEQHLHGQQADQRLVVHRFS